VLILSEGLGAGPAEPPCLRHYVGVWKSKQWLQCVWSMSYWTLYEFYSLQFAIAIFGLPCFYHSPCILLTAPLYQCHRYCHCEVIVLLVAVSVHCHFSYVPQWCTFYIVQTFGMLFVTKVSDENDCRIDNHAWVLWYRCWYLAYK